MGYRLNGLTCPVLFGVNLRASAASQATTRLRFVANRLPIISLLRTGVTTIYHCANNVRQTSAAPQMVALIARGMKNGVLNNQQPCRHPRSRTEKTCKLYCSYITPFVCMCVWLCARERRIWHFFGAFFFGAPHFAKQTIMYYRHQLPSAHSHRNCDFLSS